MSTIVRKEVRKLDFSKSPVIELPKDSMRVEQLRMKLEEYRRRVFQGRWSAEELFDLYLRIVLLEKLFAEGRVNTWGFAEELCGRFGGYPPRQVFNQACAVIDDYCKTGGVNNRGGTGLPKVQVH